MDLTNWKAFWGMDESADGSIQVTRADRIGSNHLDLDGGAHPPSTTGLVYPLACDFTRADGEALGAGTGNPDLSPGDEDFFVAAWLKVKSKPAAITWLVGKADATAVGDKIIYGLIWHNALDRFIFTSCDQDATALSAPSINTWYLLIGQHDAANNLVKLSINAGTEETTGTARAPAVPDFPFVVGGLSGDSSASADAVIGPVMFGKRLLTAPERTSLYNGGAGRTYAQLAGSRFFLSPG